MFQHKNELAGQKLAALLRDDHSDGEAIARLCRETGFPAVKRYIGINCAGSCAIGFQKADLEAVRNIGKTTASRPSASSRTEGIVLSLLPSKITNINGCRI